MASIPSDILDDICTRFLVNLPVEERSDPIRICFQIEYAHWFYIDFYCQTEDNCQMCGLREFTRLVFHHCKFLSGYRSRVDEIVDQWRRYKASVPTYGAILLDHSLHYILLVQGFYAKNSWGFPKGKVNEDEPPLSCAVREVEEETGFNCAHLIREHQYLEWQQSKDSNVTRMYIVPGVENNFQFKPQTRNEIRKIQWFRISDLPTSSIKSETNQRPTVLQAAQLFTVLPFMDGVRKFVTEHKKSPSAFTPVRAKCRPKTTPKHQQALGLSGEVASVSGVRSVGSPVSLEEIFGFRPIPSPSLSLTLPCGVEEGNPVFEAVPDEQMLNLMKKSKPKGTCLDKFEFRLCPEWTNVELDYEAVLRAF